MRLFDSIRQRLRRGNIHKEVARLRELTVAEIMTKYVITVSPQEEVVKAATKMIAEDISCLVVSDGEKAVGVLSERDFLRKVPLSGKVFDMKVKDIMRMDIITIPPTTKLPEAVAIMKKENVRRLIVAEQNSGRLLGVVTQTDFTRAISKVFSSYPVVPELSTGHIMTKDVLSIGPKATVAEAKQKMLKANVGCIVIRDKDMVLGIFTEYDVVMQFYDQHGKLEMNDISKYMRKYVRAAPQEESIFEANRLMLEKNMRRLLIVEGTKVVGIVTQTDICRYAYSVLDLIERAADDPKNRLKRFSLSTEIHGEFHGEHLKVYTVE